MNYLYAIYTSRGYVWNYVRIVCHGGGSEGHSDPNSPDRYEGLGGRPEGLIVRAMEPQMLSTF